MKWKQLGKNHDFNVFKGKSAGHGGTEQSGGREQVLDYLVLVLRKVFCSPSCPGTL